jgi:hypothetical protein
VLVRRENLRWVAHGDPADRDRRPRRQDGVDVHDATDPDLAARPGHRAGKQGRARGQEAAVADPGAVDVGVRADKHVVADDRGVPGAAADHRVLHHDAPRAEADLPVLGGEHGAEQHPGAGPDADGAADDRRRRDVGGGIDFGGGTAMLNQHVPSLPAGGAGGQRGVIHRRTGAAYPRLIHRRTG